MENANVLHRQQSNGMRVYIMRSQKKTLRKKCRETGRALYPKTLGGWIKWQNKANGALATQSTERNHFLHRSTKEVTAQEYKEQPKPCEAEGRPRWCPTCV